ncbi:MAG: ComF family protein [Nitrospirae bacterium]|nr:ComF family protein [Nitrospirota bacterium]
MLNKLLNVLFPESCPVCRKPSTFHKTAPICAECWDGISPYNGAICRICGKSLVSDASIECGGCITKKPVFKQARSFGLYDGTLKEAINLLKYHKIKRLSKPLSAIISTAEITGTDAVLPVPLYKKRLRHREFNQSALLAKYLAGNMGVPLAMGCLVKVRDTMPQVGLSAQEREKNIKNAFEVRDKGFIQGKTLMLVDDVITTGATVRECSRQLKKAGAKYIYVMALAHGKMD